MPSCGRCKFLWTKFTWKFLLELQRYWTQLKAWAIGFQMVHLKKLSCTKIIVHGETLLKSVGEFRFSEKPRFYCHSEMVGMNNFAIVLCIWIVNALIFIFLNIGKLVQDQFVLIVKDHQYDNLIYVDKIMPFL